MERLRRSSAALAAATIVLAVGCTSDGSGPDDEPGAAGPTDVADLEEVTPSGRLQLTGWTQQHAKLVDVSVLAIEVLDGGHVAVEFEAVNNGTGVNVVRLSGLGGMLVDDRGGTYGLRRPADNDSMLFRRDERMSGTLVYQGPIDPEARRVSIAFNQTDGEVVTASQAGGASQYTRFGFLDVPLPGVGLEDEAIADPEASGQDLLTRTTIDVDRTVEASNREGFEVTVVGYESDGRTLEFEVEVRNGSSSSSALLAEQPSLRDGQGTNFAYVGSSEETRDERQVRLEPGEEATVTVAFRGTISGSAEALELRFNPSLRDQPNPRVPIVDVDEIPVP